MPLGGWPGPLLAGLILWLGILGGSSATMHWLSTRILARIETATARDLDIEENRQTQAQLVVGTWEIELRKIG